MKNFETKNGNENCTIVVIKLLINYKNNKNSIPPISTRYPEHREGEHHLSISNFIHGKIPQEITKSSPHFFPPPNAEFTWCEQRKSRGAIIPFLTLIPFRGGLSSKIPGTEPLQPNSTAIRRRDLNTAERCNLFSPPPTIETNCLRGLGWRVFASLEWVMAGRPGRVNLRLWNPLETTVLELPTGNWLRGFNVTE